MDSDSCDDIEIVEVVSLKKKPKIRKWKNAGKSKMRQPCVSQYFSVIEDTSSSDTIVYDMTYDKPNSINSSLSFKEHKDMFYSLNPKVENGEVSNAFVTENKLEKSCNKLSEKHFYSVIAKPEEMNISDAPQITAENKKITCSLYSTTAHNKSVSETVCVTEQESEKNINNVIKYKKLPYMTSPKIESIRSSSNITSPKIESIGSSSNIISDTDHQTTIDQMQSKIVLQKFILKWKELKGNQFRSDDRKVEQKLWKYYNESNVKYTSSRKFFSAVKNGTADISEKTVYLFIKEIIDKLKYNRESGPKITSVKSCQAEKSSEVSSDDRNSLKGTKTETKLLKLEKLMNKLTKKIKSLDEDEVDFSDENNSAYLLQDRLKKQLMRVNNHYCKLAECSTRTGRPIDKKFKFNGTRYPEINNRISAWVNKYKGFPDYIDILELVKKVVDTKKLPLRPEAIRIQAEDIFANVGKLLKRRRLKDDLFSLYAYGTEDLPVDPAQFDDDLDSKLMSNATEAKVKLDQVFQLYVDKEIEKGAPDDSTDSSEEDEEGSTHSNDAVDAYISDMEESRDGGEMSSSKAPQNLCSSKRYAYSTPSASMDSLPDLNSLLEGSTENKIQSDKSLEAKLDNEANKTEAGASVVGDCNGLQEDHSSNAAQVSHFKMKMPQVEEDLVTEGINNSFNNGTKIETINIDSNTCEEDAREYKKRRRREDIPGTKRRCVSPEVVEID